MDQNSMKNFQVIGRCAKMQTLSLDQVTNLLDGVPYEIDFSQDFSAARLNGYAIADISTGEIVMAMLEPSVPALPPTSYPTYEEREFRQKLITSAEKQLKKERRREEKWERKHPKPCSAKQASKNLNHLLKKMGV